MKRNMTNKKIITNNLPTGIRQIIFRGKVILSLAPPSAKVCEFPNRKQVQLLRF